MFFYYPLYVYFSHAASLLTAICKARGIDADYAACDRDFLERIVGYDIVGFSCVTDLDYYGCLLYMKTAKDYGKKVIAGGVYARRGGHFDPRVVDYVCRGDGEIIADYLLNGDMKIFNEKHYQKSLDDLPLPDLSHVTGFEFDRGYEVLKSFKIIPYQTSRGCPYKCSFCETRFQPEGIRIKHTIEKDLNYLHETYKPHLFYFMDSLPPYYMKSWKAQFENLFFRFQCFIRADIYPENLEFLIKHGLTMCGFGVETGSEEFRNNGLKKKLTNKQIFETVKILQMNSILYSPFYIINLPNETEKEKKMTEEMIDKIGGFPVTGLYRNLKESTMEV